MKFTVTKPTEIEVAFVHVTLPVEFGDEDIPIEFPMRVGNVWFAKIGIDDGLIVGWPKVDPGMYHMYMKVCDGGVYRLIGPDGVELSKIEHEYIPGGLIPGEDGDYIDFKIDANGIITNWPKRPNIDQFFPTSE